MFVGDFNDEESEPRLSQLFYEYNMAEKIAKGNTCIES